MGGLPRPPTEIDATRDPGPPTPRRVHHLSHWSLLIRLREPDGTVHFYHMDSLDNFHKEYIEDVLAGSDLAPETWDRQIHEIQGLQQMDLVNCGICVCLHAYAWLLHDEPLSINWTRLHEKIPQLIPKFRDYIAASLITGEIENEFANSYISTILNTTVPANRPIPQLNIQEMLELQRERQAAIDDAESVDSSATSKSGRSSSKQARKRKSKARKRTSAQTKYKREHEQPPPPPPSPPPPSSPSSAASI